MQTWRTPEYAGCARSARGSASCSAAEHDRGLRTNLNYDLATKLFVRNKQNTHSWSLVDSVSWLYFFEGWLVSAKFTTSKMSQTNSNKEFTMTKEVRIIFIKTSCWNWSLSMPGSVSLTHCPTEKQNIYKTIQANVRIVHFQQNLHVKYTL